MGHKKHMLRFSLAASTWVLTASLACAQEAPANTATVTTTPASAEPRVPQSSITTMSNNEANTSFAMSHPGEPMVDQTTRITFPNRPLLITGTTLFVLSYAPTVIFQAVEERNKDLYIPVVGPWLDFAKGDDGNLARTALAVDGVIQGLGALSLVSSLFIPEKRTSRWYLIGGRKSAFNLSPSRLSQTGYGMSATGSF